MSDVIERMRKQQREVAAVIAGRLVKELAPDMEGSGEELTKLLNETTVPLDREALHEQLVAEIHHDTFAAVVGYTDWLATKVYREYLRTKVPRDDIELPIYDTNERESIEKKYQVDSEVLDSVAAAFRSGAAALPCIGRVVAGRLRIDTQNLNAWAALFQW